MKTDVSSDALAFPSVGQQEKGVEIRLCCSYCKSFQLLFAEDAEMNHMDPFYVPFLVSPSPLMVQQL